MGSRFRAPLTKLLLIAHIKLFFFSLAIKTQNLSTLFTPPFLVHPKAIAQFIKASDLSIPNGYSTLAGPHRDLQWGFPHLQLSSQMCRSRNVCIVPPIKHSQLFCMHRSLMQRVLHPCTFVVPHFIRYLLFICPALLPRTES